MLNQTTRQRLLDQGFCNCDLDSTPALPRLARWTPLACAAFGTLGIALQFFYSSMVHPLFSEQCQCWAKSPYNIGGVYFLVLGAFTLTGGFSDSSIFDRLYNVLLRPLFGGSPIPPHGAPRRFGCAIGGLVYMASGAAFLLAFRTTIIGGGADGPTTIFITTHNLLLPAVAYGLAIFMIVFALIAGITQWCFASTLYKFLFAKK